MNKMLLAVVFISVLMSACAAQKKSTTTSERAPSSICDKPPESESRGACDRGASFWGKCENICTMEKGCFYGRILYRCETQTIKCGEETRSYTGYVADIDEYCNY